MHRQAVVLAFVLGACTTAAVGSAVESAVPTPAQRHEAAPQSDLGTTSSTSSAPPATVVSASHAPKRRSPSGTAVLTELARGNNAYVGRLELEPLATVPEHRDPTEEYIVVLEGSGSMTIDGVRHDIGPGSAIFMPANSTVSVTNGPARLVGLQVFAGPESADKYKTWQSLR